MPISQPRIDLRPGVTEPVVLMISRRQVQKRDLASVLESLKPFTAAREDAWLYRGQMALVVDGYNDDPRELVDIPEVRVFLKSLYESWSYWAFFFNQVDDSIKVLGSCVSKGVPTGSWTTFENESIDLSKPSLESVDPLRGACGECSWVGPGVDEGLAQIQTPVPRNGQDSSKRNSP